MSAREVLSVCEIQERLDFLAEKTGKQELKQIANKLDELEEIYPELADSF